MPALAIEVEPCHVGRAYVEVSACQLFVDDEALELASDRRARGQPQRQPSPHALIDHEQLQVLADPLVIPLLRLLQELEVVLEVFRGRP